MAVWEGAQPGDDSAAADEFKRRAELLDRDETPTEPTRRYDSPWAGGPIADDASGSLV